MHIFFSSDEVEEMLSLVEEKLSWYTYQVERRERQRRILKRLYDARDEEATVSNDSFSENLMPDGYENNPDY